MTTTVAPAIGRTSSSRTRPEMAPVVASAVGAAAVVEVSGGLVSAGDEPTQPANANAKTSRTAFKGRAGTATALSWEHKKVVGPGVHGYPRGLARLGELGRDRVEVVGPVRDSDFARMPQPCRRLFGALKATEEERAAQDGIRLSLIHI